MKIKQKSIAIVQSNKLVEARYSLTVGEQRLIFAMTSMIHPDDVDFFVYEMRVKDLAELLNFDLKYAYSEIDKITDKLMERVLHIPEGKGWLKIGWVSSSRYNNEKGTVSFKFDPDLKPYLLKLKKEFTKSKLLILTQFQSIYSIRIYQLLNQYKNIGHREFRVDDLKEILGLKKTQYPAFKDFRRWVLDQAKKEFEKKNEKGQHVCDLTFKIETTRESRRISRIYFTIIQQECYEQIQEIPLIKEGVKPKEPEINNNIPEPDELEELDKKIFNEFLEYVKENDKFIYDFYLEHGRAFMVQNEYIKFLERREEEQKAQQG